MAEKTGRYDELEDDERELLAVWAWQVLRNYALLEHVGGATIATLDGVRSHLTTAELPLFRKLIDG